MKNKPAIVLSLLLMLSLLAIGGCGQPVEPTPEPPDTMTYDVVLYFTNMEYVETGDQSLPVLLTETSEIEVGAEEEPYHVLLKALSTPVEEAHGTMISEQLVIHKVAYSPEGSDLLLVDLAKEGLTGGSLGESLLISQIVETLLANESLAGDRPTPTRVQFLVDGEIVESLMGHIDASAPFESKQ
ncbi:MAG: hypothetical protein CVU86_02160 [Firmicutes bacterium HGW-Firmicutes-11]|jgi:hypothetical protein|nr:MAG: hypothetical protein CVU86_02160 [Firmicutes bacterium HGW-Firmicutes-11]